MVNLRPAIESDFPALFEQEQDVEANRMIGFYERDPSDRAAFEAHWRKIIADPTTLLRAIITDDRLAGHVVSFVRTGVENPKREVGYRLGRAFWGRGIATEALRQLLVLDSTRPLYAGAASDNLASIRVLEKCGFRKVETLRAYSKLRGEEIEETILKLE